MVSVVVISSWHSLPRLVANELYEQTISSKNGESIRHLFRNDLFFVLTVACNRADGNNDWVFDRCREVEANPDGYLDLWFRESYKSTIITFAKTIQDIARDPEETFGIFSHTRPIAKAFLKQIKLELEINEFIKRLFSDIFYQNPERESPTWSLDGGLTVRRKSNPKECTIEAWGLVDGQPTSKHFRRLLYDDIVVRESVSTPEMIQKTTEGWELSQNLGAAGGTARYAGTIYHFHDTYAVMIERGAVKVRKYPATKDGTPDGESVFIPQDILAQKRRNMGPYTFAAQMLLNPVADEAQGFKEDWIQYYDQRPDHRRMNVYVIVDPANAKKKHNDFTVIEVWGASSDNNYYLLDAVRDRLNLTERTEQLFKFHRMYHPYRIGYEEYGMQADVQHIQYVQAQQQYRFQIVELSGNVPKVDRIRSMIPLWESGRMWLPRRLLKTGYDRKEYDFIQKFKDEEFLCFPVGVHDDMLDCCARLTDPMLGVIFPLANAGRQAYTEGDMHAVESKPVIANNKYERLPGYGVS